MKNLSSWLLLIFSILFLVFRVVLALLVESESGWNGFMVFNYNIEIALIFISIISIMLILRRNLIGGII